MRVVHLANHHSIGGASRASFRIHLALAQSKDFSSKFLTFSSSPGPEYDSVRPIKSSPQVFNSRLLGRVSSLLRHHMSDGARLLYDFLLVRNRSVEQQVEKEQPDVLIVHWVRPRDVPARTIRRLSLPTIFVLHDARAVIGTRHYPDKQDPSYRKPKLLLAEKIGAALVRASLWRQNVGIVCPSDWMSTVAEACGWRQNSCFVVPYPLDLEFWCPPKKIVPSERKKILSVGFGFHGRGAAVRKGAEVFDEALHYLATMPLPQHHELEIVTFGDAETPGFFQRTETSLRITERGHLRDGEFRGLLQRLSVLAIPSRFENLAQVSLEAQACGTAVVVADNTGLTSTLCAESGKVFTNGSGKHLAERLYEFLEAPHLIDQAGNAARDYAEQAFSGPYVTSGYSHVVSRLTGETQARGTLSTAHTFASLFVKKLKVRR